MNLLQKVGVSLLGLKSVYQPGFTMLYRDLFSWGNSSKSGNLINGYSNKIVYSVVNVIVGKLIEAPIIVSKEKGNTRKFLAKSRFSENDIMTGRLKAMQLKALEEQENHPLNDLLSRPNDYQTGIDFREALWFNYHLSGDMYIWAEIMGDGRNVGKPVYLHVLPSQNVVIVKNQTDWRNPVLRYDITTWTGQIIQLQPETVMHMSKWSPNDPSQGGYSPQNAIAKTISKNEQNQIAQGSAFINGGTGTIISSDTAADPIEGKYHKLTTDQMSKIKDTIQREWVGAANNKRVHVTNGYVNVQKLGDTLAELQLIEANKADVADICAAYGISPILLGDMSGGTENNVKAAYKALVTNGTISDLRKFDMKFAQFSKDWYPGIICSHDITEYSELAPDLKLMKEVFSDAPYLTPNEKRRLFNYDEDDKTEGMNTYLFPSGLVPLEDLINPIDQNISEGDAKYRDYRD